MYSFTSYNKDIFLIIDNIPTTDIDYTVASFQLIEYSKRQP